ncbi:hypothetical protein TNCV_3575001 [Trichonephila clavipes]|nr:hypothetical protein TNCV_3575001 [Trichonephila clavipes]
MRVKSAKVQSTHVGMLRSYLKWSLHCNRSCENRIENLLQVGPPRQHGKVQKKQDEDRGGGGGRGPVLRCTKKEVMLIKLRGLQDPFQSVTSLCDRERRQMVGDGLISGTGKTTGGTVSCGFCTLAVRNLEERIKILERFFGEWDVFG